MICYPNAKINLGLKVVSKRTDGYHNLESIFLPIDLCDVLEVIPSEGDDIRLTVHGIQVTGDASDNLVAKAYHLINSKYDIGGVEVHLLKNIPTGSGMGGGSSDGVFMLKALCELFDLEVSHQEMFHWALKLGSDCPFFLYNQPCFVSGRGEEIEPLTMDLSDYDVRVVHPGIHISTAGAFAKIMPSPNPVDLKHAATFDASEWPKVFSNDFQNHAMESSPMISEIIHVLHNAGALYASMTGSGSAVYGVFRKNTVLDFTMPYFIRDCRFL